MCVCVCVALLHTLGSRAIASSQEKERDCKRGLATPPSFDVAGPIRVVLRPIAPASSFEMLRGIPSVNLQKMAKEFYYTADAHNILNSFPFAL